MLLSYLGCVSDYNLCVRAKDRDKNDKLGAGGKEGEMVKEKVEANILLKPQHIW